MREIEIQPPVAPQPGFLEMTLSKPGFLDLIRPDGLQVRSYPIGGLG